MGSSFCFENNSLSRLAVLESPGDNHTQANDFTLILFGIHGLSLDIDFDNLKRNIGTDSVEQSKSADRQKESKPNRRESSCMAFTVTDGSVIYPLMHGKSRAFQSTKFFMTLENPFLVYKKIIS